MLRIGVAAGALESILAKFLRTLSNAVESFDRRVGSVVRLRVILHSLHLLRAARLLMDYFLSARALESQVAVRTLRLRW